MADVRDKTEVDNARKVDERPDAQGPQLVVEASDGHGAQDAVEDDEEAIETEVITDNGAEVVVRKRPLYKRPVFLAIAAIVLLVSAILGIRYWLYARAHESTDDAFIDGHIVQVSPKVSGYVAKVYVKDNQEVQAGDLIAELDARDYEAKLEQAKAALAAGEARLREAHTSVELTRANTRATTQQAAATVQQARTGVASSRAAAAAERSRISQSSAGVATAQANLAQARSQVAAAEAEATRANADVQRYQELYAKDEISRQRLDEAIAAA